MQNRSDKYWHSKDKRNITLPCPYKICFSFCNLCYHITNTAKSFSNPNQPSAWAGAFPRPNGQLSFSSNRDDNFEIYAMTDDGIDGTRLTNNDANDFEPSWSPDGEKIALAALEMASTIRKSVINADGTDQTRLTNNMGI